MVEKSKRADIFPLDIVNFHSKGVGRYRNKENESEFSFNCLENLNRDHFFAYQTSKYVDRGDDAIIHFLFKIKKKKLVITIH